MFFIESGSIIGFMLTKCSRFIKDEDQGRQVVDLMLPETLCKRVLGIRKVLLLFRLEISVSGTSTLVLLKLRRRHALHFDPELFELPVIWRFRKEFPKQSKFKSLYVSIVDGQ